LQYKYSPSDEIKQQKAKQLAIAQQILKRRKPLIVICLSIFVFLLLNIISFIAPLFITSQMTLPIRVLFSFVVGNVIMTFIEITLSSNAFYTHLCKKINCPLDIKFIDVHDAPDEEVIPEIIISFDVTSCSSLPMAVTLEINPKKYYVIGLIDCSEQKRNLKMTFSTEEVKAAIKATNQTCISDDGVLTISILKCCLTNTKENMMVGLNELDTSLKICEFISIPSLKKTEANQ